MKKENYEKAKEIQENIQRLRREIKGIEHDVRTASNVVINQVKQMVEPKIKELEQEFENL